MDEEKLVLRRAAGGRKIEGTVFAERGEEEDADVAEMLPRAPSS